MAEVDDAFELCLQARRDAAEPLRFAQDAEDSANARTKAQFHQNLALVGGLAKAQDSLLRASKLYGALAKAIALFQKPGTDTILLHHEQRAREIMEEECKFRVAHVKNKLPGNLTVTDGTIC